MAKDGRVAKKAWASKSVWTNAIIGLAPFIPGASDWISANPTAFGVAVALLNLGLRSVTGESVTWKLIDRKL